MKILRGGTWKRRGVSVLWDPASLLALAPPASVATLRHFVRLSDGWPEPQKLPGGGDALVVAGMKGALEVLTADEARDWLHNDLRRRIISFQDHYEGQVALVFWFPASKAPFVMSPADEEYTWPSAHGRSVLPFGRCLWSGAQRDVERIVVGDGDVDGPGWVGLYHPRIS